jgi:UDP-glucose 4-epimerase
VRVLVTGATGFVGTPLCKVLVDRGHEVMGISRKPPPDRAQPSEATYVTYLMGEPLPASVVSFLPEVMVHLSWSGIPDFSADTCTANVATQIQFLAEAKRLSRLKKILVAGSCSEYGAKRGLCQEVDRNSPDSYFSWAKQTLCDYFHLVCKERTIPLLWFRIFYVYGPGQRSAALIPTLLEAFRSGQKPDIRNPNAANDFVFVGDVVDAFVRGIEQDDAAGILNLGSGRQSTVLEVSQIAERRVNRTVMSSDRFVVDPPDQEMQPAMVADVSHAKSVLAWEPKVGLAAGIARTAEMTA